MPGMTQVTVSHRCQGATGDRITWRWSGRGAVTLFYRIWGCRGSTGDSDGVPQPHSRGEGTQGAPTTVSLHAGQGGRGSNTPSAPWPIP